MRRKKGAVVLVSPPWGRLDMPSLSCATLKPVLERAGRRARVVHLNLELAAALGAEDYHALADDTLFLGDAVFSSALGGARRRDWGPLCALVARRFRRARGPGSPGAARLRSLAASASAAAAALLASDVLAACARAPFVVLSCERDVFNQSIPAAAVARRVKELSPRATTILTGQAVEGPVAAAFLEAFPWIDWVAQGDPELVVPALLDSLEAGVEPPAGAVARGGPSDRYGLLDGLEALPEPDFDGFFDELKALRRRGLLVPEVVLPFEGGRGCWWGARSHCRFCNLNDATITPRVKSGARAAEELLRLSRRHKTLRFAAVDNILPLGYEKEFLPRLAGLDLRLFYEMKPQAGRAQVAALARAGVREIQPGIETFSSRLLASAGKGVTAAQNVVFMKWARHYGIDLRYYLLHGFPGETAEDYARVLAALPRLRHLQPPLRLRRLALTRGSPYFDFPERYGIRGVRPYPEYAAALPDAGLDWSRAAVSFDHELPGERQLSGPARRLSEEVERWRALWAGRRPPALELRRGEGFIELVDSRAGNGRRDATRWEGDAAWAYLACGDAPASREELLSAARAEGRALDASRLARALETFDELGLAWREGELYFALALPYRTGFREYDILSVRRPASGASVEAFQEDRA